MWIDRRGFGGGRVETAAGPWRTSGAWWEEALLAPKPRSGDDGRVTPKPRSGDNGRVTPKPRSSDDGRVTPKPRSGEGGWDRDEWDVALADGVTYRLFRERNSGAWFVEGVVD